MTILPGKNKPTTAEALRRPCRLERLNIDEYVSMGRLQHFAWFGLFIEMTVRSYILWLPSIAPALHPYSLKLLSIRQFWVPQTMRILLDDVPQATDMKDILEVYGGNLVLGLGFFVGVIFWNALPLTWGRRQLVITSVLLFSIAHWLQALMQSPLILLGLQSLVGFGMGQLTVVWMLELVQSKNRAAVASIAAAGWAAGGLLAIAGVLLLSHFSPNILEVAPTMLIILSLLIYTILCPESPQVMVLQWSHEKATQEMQRIARINNTLAEYRTIPEVFFRHGRSYRSVCDELQKAPLYTAMTFIAFFIIGALFSSAYVHLVATVRLSRVLYALVDSGVWLAVAAAVAWLSPLFGRRTLLNLALLLTALCGFVNYLQPFIPAVLAILQFFFVVLALVILCLTTIEWYPATSRTMGLACGVIATMAGAAGFWLVVVQADLRFVSSAVLAIIGFFITLCRPETATLVPRLQTTDAIDEVDPDDEEGQYLLPHD